MKKKRTRRRSQGILTLELSKFLNLTHAPRSIDYLKLIIDLSKRKKGTDRNTINYINSMIKELNDYMMNIILRDNVVVSILDQNVLSNEKLFSYSIWQNNSLSDSDEVTTKVKNLFLYTDDLSYQVIKFKVKGIKNTLYLVVNNKLIITHKVYDTLQKQ